MTRVGSIWSFPANNSSAWKRNPNRSDSVGWSPLAPGSPALLNPRRAARRIKNWSWKCKNCVSTKRCWCREFIKSNPWRTTRRSSMFKWEIFQIGWKGDFLNRLEIGSIDSDAECHLRCIYSHLGRMSSIGERKVCRSLVADSLLATTGSIPTAHILSRLPACLTRSSLSDVFLSVHSLPSDSLRSDSFGSLSLHVRRTFLSLRSVGSSTERLISLSLFLREVPESDFHSTPRPRPWEYLRERNLLSFANQSDSFLETAKEVRQWPGEVPQLSGDDPRRDRLSDYAREELGHWRPSLVDQVSRRTHDETGEMFAGRDLHFLSSFLHEFGQANQTVEEAMNKAYPETLKPYHGWITRGIFSVKTRLREDRPIGPVMFLDCISICSVQRRFPSFLDRRSGEHSWHRISTPGLFLSLSRRESIFFRLDLPGNARSQRNDGLNGPTDQWLLPLSALRLDWNARLTVSLSACWRRAFLSSR